MKENTESRSRGVNGISNRSRGASDRDVRHSMSTAFSSNGMYRIKNHDHVSSFVRSCCQLAFLQWHS